MDLRQKLSPNAIMEDWELLEQLTSVPGVSGFEEPVRRFIAQHLQGLGLAYHVDNLGNLIAHIPGTGQRVLFIAHMDEVGHIVCKIRSDGYLSIERIGGISTRALAGQTVEVGVSAEKALPGVVGVCPQHLESRNPALPSQRPFVDIGARSRDEAIALGVKLGAPVTYAPHFSRLGPHLIRGKALDDRVGCYLLLQVAKRWARQKPPVDLYLAFVVQEESNLRGAMPVTEDVDPQCIIGLDVTLAFDTPDLAQTEQSEVVLGQGPAIKIMDHLPGTLQGIVIHSGLREHIEKIATQENIPLQYEILMGLTTAISPLPFMKAGIAAAGLSLPSRYNHSPVEVVSADDIKATAMLLNALVASPWPKSDK